MEKYLEGLFLQASLILALGAQNLFVLDSALNKRRHLLVSTICFLCDTLLILFGVLGAASIFLKYPWLKIGFGGLGVSFLVYYGILKLREKPNFKNTESSQKDLPNSVPVKEVILKTLGFSLLNPHVYLDTVVLIGGYSTQFTLLSDRLSFGLGASTCSLFWFFGLSIFAASMSKYINNYKIMRWISIISGIILLLLAYNLGEDVWKWIS